MLKIRLQRIGRRNDPSYRIVVIEDSRGPKSGDFVERVGSHNPKTKETTLNAERVTHWLSVGAKASGTVHNMLVKAGIIKADKINVLPKKSPIIKEEQEKQEEKDDNKEEGQKEEDENKNAEEDSQSGTESDNQDEAGTDTSSDKENDSDQEEQEKAGE